MSAATVYAGTRSGEIERGAVTTFHGSPAVRSKKIKHDPTQSRQRWGAIEPVAEAITVAERLSWHESHIFATLNPPPPARSARRPSSGPGGGASKPGTTRRHVHRRRLVATVTALRKAMVGDGPDLDDPDAEIEQGQQHVPVGYRNR
jgi:hypothetical protein